ncbi:CRISPR-associated helicase Cas3' [Prosthecochloris sp. HL-130-GSB]|uniref:CRISPR-associated helicase Cas3' n=1 Tax=Prosthecochloris sp. HL-130-GSB TaxID=1974213 RepID=UPI000A1C12BA|nr:CRISPR-associated helicase Cas3' [Prosthecochloris sp. HL-130-GSB]ARM31064.1 CRISPR-associated helicase Cas3' [Prosthecochloris sp. HL-130-GSB]
MKKIDHSTAGALHAVEEAGGYGRILAYLIAGHHAGLPDWYPEPGTGGALSGRLENKEHLEKALSGLPPSHVLKFVMPTTYPCNQQSGDSDLAHVWIRMLYSCLVDADFLDTEAFMEPEKALSRKSDLSLAVLKKRFDAYMDEKQAEAHSTPINAARQNILIQCRRRASLVPGLFSLTVPTGGGKTLSSMAFALEHALKYGKDRIIVAIPFTSIIEQTAEEYRKIFGDEAVLEHHSNLDPKKESVRNRLASENWDAPIIVTTNVQLFESLFAAKSSACRKLHNIVNSVVILDEVQTLPTDYLQPIISILRVLSNYFNTSIVLCTATQPVLTGKIGSGTAALQGFENDAVRELIDDPKRLFQIFQRVRIELMEGEADKRLSWEQVAESMMKHRQALAIVNTRKDCRSLYDIMPDGTVHLSALMCPEHRSDVIFEIKHKLRDDKPVHVVSTQLLEAGVDIDFPIVFRAFSGLDRIAQAAGRCNREGRLENGKVFVFNPPDASPSGLLLKAEHAGQEMFRVFPELASSLMPEAFQRYFTLYFNGLNDFDKKEILDLLAGPDVTEFKIQFRTAAWRFKIINDANQHGIIVKYNSENKKAHVEALIEQLKYAGPSRMLMRALQRFSVNVYDNDLRQMRDNGTIEEINGVWVQTVPDLYSSVFGVDIDATPNFYL